MNRTRVVLPLAIALLACGPFSQTSTVARSDRATSVGPGRPEQPETMLVVRGTVKAYDLSSKVLAVSTSTGTTEFTITSDVRIRQGWRRIDASALEKLSGYRVAVRYLVSGGSKTVESVRVFRKDDRSQF